MSTEKERTQREGSYARGHARRPCVRKVNLLSAIVSIAIKLKRMTAEKITSEFVISD